MAVEDKIHGTELMVCTSDDSTEKVNPHVDFRLDYTQRDKIMCLL